jgi:hypothetical protein
MAEQLPGKGFLGWLGRQVGYVARAVKSDAGGGKTVYRDQKVEETRLPQDPSVTLRRTTIDEVIVNRDPAAVLHEQQQQRREDVRDDARREAQR